jgi:methylated-DNA-[protein]-cysteine S-methyltransferase
MLYCSYYPSPVGNIRITADDDFIYQVCFTEDIPRGTDLETSASSLIEETKRQLSLYFGKELQDFNLPVGFKSTEFQKRVMVEVQKVPFGQTITYTQLASRLGSVRLTRAVAAANAANTNLIIIPCHRVVGKNNKLTGYAGELWRKKWLLDHENMMSPKISW